MSIYDCLIILSINKKEATMIDLQLLSDCCLFGEVNMKLVILCLITMHAVFSSGEVAVLILARGGSKGVRLKNLQTIGGISLLTRAIYTSKAAGLHDVTVSTDHPLIALVAVKSGAAVFHRSYVTATDWAPSLWGASEFLASRPNVTILILIQATSPFLRATQLNSAINKIKYPIPFDCVFSVTRSYKLRWRDLDHNIYPINFKLDTRPRRQDWNGELLETGAFYITRRELIKRGYFQNHNCTVVELSAVESFEVDSYQDLKVANALLISNLV